MMNNLIDILLWIESPENFNEGIGSVKSKDQYKTYSDLIRTQISKPVHEWMELGKNKLEESISSLLVMRKSVSSLINHFENQEDYYEKDHYESIIGQPHVYDALPPKGISDERLEKLRQERLIKEKKAVDDIRKNKDNILSELHTKIVILNTWHNELSDQLKTIKRSKIQSAIESKPAKSEINELKYSEAEYKSEQHLKVEDAFDFMQNKDRRKHELILNKDDFNNLIEWVTYYFEKDESIPLITSPIKKVNTIRGNVYHTFKTLYWEIHPSATLPDSLFELIKSCFHEYREDKIPNMRKTRKPQFYDDSVNKTD